MTNNREVGKSNRVPIQCDIMQHQNYYKVLKDM